MAKMTIEKVRHLMDKMDWDAQNEHWDESRLKSFESTFQNNIRKDSLRGQKLNIEVFKIHFPDLRNSSYIWGMNGQIIAAGSMSNALAVLDEVSETYRQGNPGHIYLHFPKKVSTVSMANGNGHSRILPLTSVEVANFSKGLAHFNVFSIAKEASAS